MLFLLLLLACLIFQKYSCGGRCQLATWCTILEQNFGNRLENSYEFCSIVFPTHG